MQNPRTFRVVERLGQGGILGLGLAGLASLAAILPAATPLLADVGLGLLGAGALGGAGWAYSMRRRLAELPLSLAPVVARRVVDGVVVHSVRACLGRGRGLTRAEVEVAWHPEGGAPVPLRAELPTSARVGPFSVVVPDPGGVVDGPGALHVQVTVHSRGRTWTAREAYPPARIVEGRFGGVVPGRRGVTFTDAWGHVDSAEPLTADPPHRGPGSRTSAV